MVESIEELRNICRKDQDPDAFESWRKFSIYFTKLLLHTNITANQTTVLGALFGVIAGIFIANGNRLYIFVGALLLYLHFVFDLVDGQIARYRKSSNLTGAYIERLCHYIVNSFVFFSMAFGLYATFHNVWIFALGFSASLSQVLISLVREMKFIVVARAFLGYKGYVGKLVKDCEIEPQEGENYGRIRVRDAEEKHIASASSTLYAVSRLAYRMVTQPYRLHVILFASLIDLIAPVFSFCSFTFNAMYVVLFVYGIFSPLIWFGWIFLAVRAKSPDKLFSSKF